MQVAVSIYLLTSPFYIIRSLKFVTSEQSYSAYISTPSDMFLASTLLWMI